LAATAPAAARYDSEEGSARGAEGKMLQGERGGGGCWPCIGAWRLGHGSNGPTAGVPAAAGCRWLCDGKGGAGEAAQSGRVEGEAG
jgi:hypothetical protein